MNYITELPKFKDYFEMQDYAEKNNDLELLSLIKTVNKYGDEIPKLIHRVKTNTKQYKKDADIIFTTIHKSKGQTYGNVKLADDTFDISDYFTKKYIFVPVFIKSAKMVSLFARRSKIVMTSLILITFCTISFFFFTL